MQCQFISHKKQQLTYFYYSSVATAPSFDVVRSTCATREPHKDRQQLNASNKEDDSSQQSAVKWCEINTIDLLHPFRSQMHDIFMSHKVHKMYVQTANQP